MRKSSNRWAKPCHSPRRIHCDKAMRIEKLRYDIDIQHALLGAYDENAKLFKRLAGVDVAMADGCIVVSGDEAAVDITVRAMAALCRLVEGGETVMPYDIRMALALAKEGREGRFAHLRRVVAVTAKGRPVRCRTAGQAVYVDCMAANDCVLCVGPAGTGKTYLAVAVAISAYRNKEVERIVLTRPAVEAGERLGFLPGDMREKVDPYLRPLYDALQDLVGVDNFVKMTERGVIEVAPLAYMRGRTLNNAFIILDEAQNTTCEQMKMFLTRMGEGSRTVVTGDITQIDLPRGVTSGLLNAMDVLCHTQGVGICRLGEGDVVRHDLVQRIVNAYATYNEGKDGADGAQ